jgi:quinol monooxygenase YgiN
MAKAMIIITGHVITNEANRAVIEAEGVAHCRRSRAEPGCIAHNCHWDVEYPDRLVFVEKWVDAGSLMTHFGLAASRDFVAAVTALSDEPPVLDIYRAETTSPAALAAN